jgi:hypothetical protein
MICVSCNKNKVSTSKVFRPVFDDMQEVEIYVMCIFCRSKNRQIANLNNELETLRGKTQYVERKLIELQYKLYSHIHS